MRPSIFLRLLAWWRRGRIVWLCHHDGEVSLSVTEFTPWGEVAYRFPATRIGQVLLLDNYECHGPASYVEEWRPWTPGILKVIHR